MRDLGEDTASGALVLHHGEGRVDEKQIDRAGRSEQCHGPQRVASEEIHPIFTAKIPDIAFQQLENVPILLDHEYAGGSSADGLESDGSHTGEEIDDVRAGKVSPKDIEDRLLDPLHPRPRPLPVGRCGEPS